jgi:hypothetical protein
MLIYAIVPTKPFTKELLKFAWKKPLYSVITNIISLTLIILTAYLALGIKLPLIGASTTNLPAQFTGNANITVQLTAAFQWPLYLAITAATLCIIAKIYHDKKIKPHIQTTKANQQ